VDVFLKHGVQRQTQAYRQLSNRNNACCLAQPADLKHAARWSVTGLCNQNSFDRWLHLHNVFSSHSQGWSVLYWGLQESVFDLLPSRIAVPCPVPILNASHFIPISIKFPHQIIKFRSIAWKFPHLLIRNSKYKRQS